MPITGVNVGGSATFQIGFVPPNGVPLTAGPTVETPDTSGLITLTAVDPTTNQFSASVDASATLPTFIVGVDGTNGAGEAIHADFVIPILPGAPQQITDFTLDQLDVPPPAGLAKKKK